MKLLVLQTEKKAVVPLDEDREDVMYMLFLIHYITTIGIYTLKQKSRLVSYIN